jgi:predicted nucleotidyltransferase component of viral defense system
MSRAVSNVSASVREKLQQLSKARGVSFARMLERYVLERLLYRLSVSPFREDMVLKGAMLLSLWSQTEHRPTRDVDFCASSQGWRIQQESVLPG